MFEVFEVFEVADVFEVGGLRSPEVTTHSVQTASLCGGMSDENRRRLILGWVDIGVLATKCPCARNSQLYALHFGLGTARS